MQCAATVLCSSVLNTAAYSNSIISTVKINIVDFKTNNRMTVDLFSRKTVREFLFV